MKGFDSLTLNPIKFAAKYSVVLATLSFVGCGLSRPGGRVNRVDPTAPLKVSSISKNMDVNSAQDFTVSGGTAPYSFSITLGQGTFSQPFSTQFRFVPTSVGRVQIKITDSANVSVTSDLLVVGELQLSQKNISLASGSSYQFSASSPGLTDPLTFSIDGNSYSATIDSKGLFKAPTTSLPIVVRVKVADSLSRTDFCIVNIAPSFGLNPLSVTLKQSDSQVFTPTGGFPPYRLSLSPAIGTLSSNQVETSGGNVTFNPTNPISQAATAILTVSDLNNQSLTATINVKPPIVIAPASISILQGESRTFTATGGAGTNKFSLIGTFGSVLINPDSGVLTTPTPINASLTFRVRVTDDIGQFSDSVVTVDPVLKITPTSITLSQGQTQGFAASGGTGSYTFSLNPLTGGGELLNPSGGAISFRAPASVTQDSTSILTVVDGAGRRASANILLKSPITLASPPKNLIQGGQHKFTASGGFAPYAYSIQGTANGSTINSSTGDFTAPSTVTSSFSVTVKATDSLNQSALATFDVKSPLILSPASFKMALRDTKAIVVSGGEPTYSFSIISGTTATVDANGVLHSSTATGESRFAVTDILGQRTEGVVNVQPPLTLSPMSANLAKDQTMQFIASGGVFTPQYSIEPSNLGTISPSGLYKAPPNASGQQVKVVVTDGTDLTTRVEAIVNIGLKLNPENGLVAAGKTRTFTVLGGQAPFKFRSSPNTDVNPVGYFKDTASGVFTAKNNAANSSTTITVEDAAGQSASTTLSVAEVLKIATPKQHLKQREVITLTATGGDPTNAFSVVSGPGTITTAGVFTAGTVTTKADTVVKVSNQLLQEAQLTLSTYPDLTVTPLAASLAAKKTVTITPTGGKTAYTYSLNGGAGTIDATGLYKAPDTIATPSTVRITVTDSLGQSANVTVNLKPAIQIAAVTSPVKGGATQTIVASGGDETYSFSIAAGAAGGNLSALTPPETNKKLFTATSNLAANTEVEIKVLDGLGQSASVKITVVPPVKLSAPNPDWMKPGDAAQTFTASLGKLPYSFSVVTSSGGTFTPVSGTSNKGKFTPALPSGRNTNLAVVLRVTDNLGQIAEQTVTVASPPQFLSTTYTVLSGESQEIINQAVISGKHPLTFKNTSGATIGTVKVVPSSDASYASNNSIVIARCSTVAEGVLYPPLYPAIQACPPNQRLVGTTTLRRTDTRIYHVNLEPKTGLPVRGWIYTTDLDGEQLSPAEKNGAYIIDYDTLLKELGVTTADSLYVFSSVADQSGKVEIEATDALGQKQNLVFNVLPKILPNPTTKPLSGPTAMALDSSGNIFVADSQNHRVVKYSPTGAYLTSFGAQGSGNGQLSVPRGIAINSAGNIYVAEQENHRISVFNSSLSHILTFGSSGSGNGQFSFPRGLSFDSDGNLFVADSGNNRIQKFDANGHYLQTISSVIATPSALSQPSFVRAQPNSKYLFVTDRTRAYRLNLNNDGSVSETVIYGLANLDYALPNGVSLVNDYPLVLDTPGNTFKKIVLGGSQKLSVGPKGTNNYGVFTLPQYFIPVGLGTFLVADTQGNRIQVIKPAVNNATLRAGEKLGPGSYLAPADNACDCRATMDLDGNFLVTKGGTQLWKAPITGPVAGSYLTLRDTDKNLVVLSSSTVKWNANVADQGAGVLVMGKDCNLKLLKTDDTTVLWQSNTAQATCQ